MERFEAGPLWITPISHSERVWWFGEARGRCQRYKQALESSRAWRKHWIHHKVRIDLNSTSSCFEISVVDRWPIPFCLHSLQHDGSLLWNLQSTSSHCRWKSQGKFRFATTWRASSAFSDYRTFSSFSLRSVSLVTLKSHFETSWELQNFPRRR